MDAFVISSLPSLRSETLQTAGLLRSTGVIKHRPGHNLLQTLKTFQTETLRFLTDFDVPFTNNLVEQDLRIIEGQNEKSQAHFEPSQALKPSPVVSTARKHGCDILQILTASPAQIMQVLAA